ncbi:DNA mismatch repair protein MutS [Fennellomyces sp. T-0311]|nr:DNA mismatch repair protein MutS [Fennellomyces sp. T-0311]
MALHWVRHRAGCAYYSHEFHELYMMDDVVESLPLDMVRALIEQVSPQTILVSYESDELIAAINDGHGGVQVDMLPVKAFQYQHGRYTLLSWYIRQRENGRTHDAAQSTHSRETYLASDVYCEDPHDGQRRQAYLEMSCYVNLDSEVSVGCAGALLDYLDQLQDSIHRPVGLRADADTSFTPLVLRNFSSEQCMHVPVETQRALSIFETDLHPNVHQRRGKESLSLFGLLDHTATPIGHNLLKSWILRPTLDMDVIQSRQRAVGYFSAPDTVQFAKELRGQLKYIKNIPRIVALIREHRASPTDWHNLLQFAFYAIRIHASFSPRRELVGIQVASKISHTINPDILRAVGSAINDALDFQQSKTEGRLVVKDNFDPELDCLRETYTGLDGTLLTVSREVSRDMPANVGALCNVVYFPQLGYLITLPIQLHYAVQEIHRLELQFKTAENLYFKDDKTKDLDEEIGDIHAKIIDKEIELTQILSERLSGYYADLLTMADVCAELDALLSLADAARLHQYVRPEMTLDNCLVIIQGRHPLQELCVDVFIPNDTHLIGGKAGTLSRNTSSSSTSDANTNNSVALLTGANFSGKSVGLITYMAHIGSFVPASHAVIGITDKIFSCMQTVETVSMLQSAFALDIQQLAQAVHYATDRSLVLIDEFGSGTESTDGASLLCATLGYFLHKEDLCPKIIAITHFHELLSRDIITPEDNRISFLSMEILNTQVTGENTETMEEVVFLYKVVPGSQARNSYGAWCASIAGVPTPVVKRALEISSTIYSGGTLKPIYSEEEDLVFDAIEAIARRLLRMDSGNESTVTNDTDAIETLVEELAQLIME